MLDTNKEDVAVVRSLLDLILSQIPGKKKIIPSYSDMKHTHGSVFNVEKIPRGRLELCSQDLREAMQLPENKFHEIVSYPLPHLSLQC